MSIHIVQKELLRFLSSPTAEALCLKGRWGVGKTYAWNKFLHLAKQDDAIGLSSYSYVSLFGVNSLDELKYAIFENTVSRADIGIEPSLQTLQTNTSAVTKAVAKRTVGYLRNLPGFKVGPGGINSLSFLAVRNAIICLDDLERKGGGLRVRDILGLVNFLKERRGCKIVLIMNDDDLAEEKEDLQKYLEKAIDISLSFSPTARECASIAFDSEGRVPALLKEFCVALDIRNVRLSKRIERLLRLVEPTLQEFDESIFKQAAHSIALFTWSILTPTEAPSLEFIMSRYNIARRDKDGDNKDPKHEGWTKVLHEYNFQIADDFDKSILHGVQAGHFDEDALRDAARKLHVDVEARKAREALSAVWTRYHDTFANNDEEFLNELFVIGAKYARYWDHSNFNSAVSFLREMGHSTQASELIGIYVQANESKGSQFFDLSRPPPFGRTWDDEIKAAFDKKLASVPDQRRPIDVLRKVSKGGWDRADIHLLSSLGPSEFRNVFKGYEGAELTEIVTWCLRVGAGSNDDGPKAITVATGEALKLIALEGKLNAERIKNKFGIEIGPASKAS